ncbi:MAG: hypothetical protein IKM73_00870 [Acidaminococcaceae bacterium]|nr:hypothetical protein [Acidaminococcaceae bacterium]
MGVSIWEGSKAGAAVAALERQNLLLTQLIQSQSEATPIATLNEIAEIVRRGEASNVFNIGDQINVNWNNGQNDYVLPFDITHFGDVQLQDGETIPGMFIQSHYALDGVQFDQNEAFYVVPAGGMAAGTYHFTMGNSWGTHVVSGKSYEFTLAESYAEGDLLQLGTATSEVSGLPDTAPANWRVRTYKASGSTPAGLAANATEIVTLSEGTGGIDLGTLSSSTKYGTSGLNNMQRAAYGYNRWSQSAIRQQMNSDAAAGSWFTPQNPYDRRPDQLASLRGMKAGFDEGFLNILKPVKVTTALNTVTDDQIGASEDTFDMFFLASLEQEYIQPQASGVEGQYWEYWKRRLGLTNPQPTGQPFPAHIRYAYNAKTSAQYCRLRSAFRGHAYNAWLVYPSGYASNSNATYASRAVPACVIC